MLLKRMVSVLFIFPKDVKNRKSWVNAVNRTDWSPHRHMKYSVIVLCSAHLLMDGSVSHDPVFSYNEKYRTNWTCRWLICPLLCQNAINTRWHSTIGHESGMIVVCLRFFFIPRLTTRKFDIPPFWFLELSVEG